MKASQIVDNVRKNWFPIVVCVVVALLFYLFYLFSTMDRKSFTVPLHTDSQNGMVAASSVPKSVKVTVRGKPESISTLHESDFSAYLDLNYLAKEGEVRLPVLITLSKNAMLIDPMEIKVSPEVVPLTVEEEIAAFVPVNPLVSGEPAHGYEQRSVSVTPTEVKVTGPRSMVQNCTRLQTRAVPIKGAKTDVTVSAALENPGVFLRVEQGATVSVTVKIGVETTTKTFSAVPVNFSGLDAAFEPSGSIAPIKLTLRGTVLALENYTPRVSTVLADCGGIHEAGTFDVPLKFNLPSGVTVETAPKTVSVTVGAKPVEANSAADLGGDE